MVDSIPLYHLDIITNGLVSTSLPTLGPLLGVPLSWMAINPREKSFRNEQSHHKVGGRVVDSGGGLDSFISPCNMTRWGELDSFISP